MAPLVIALLIATGWLLTGTHDHPEQDWPLWVVTAIATLMVWRTKVHLLWLLGLGALLGAPGVRANRDPDDDSILETGIDAWRRVQEVNLTSVYLCCKEVIPYMQRQGKGSIVNTASFVATMGAATSQISYTASKGGVLAMSRELGVQSGVNVPLQAAEHYYVITDEVPGISKSWPVLEDPASYGYFREEGGGLMIGLFEPVCAPWKIEGVPHDFSFGPP